MKNYLFGLILISIILSGCTTPGWLRPIRWKAEKTPVCIAIDYFEIGQKYEAAGNRIKAIEQYQKAQQISPRPVIYYRLGLLYAAEGDFLQAQDNLQKALELIPDFNEARRELEILESARSNPPIAEPNNIHQE